MIAADIGSQTQRPLRLIIVEDDLVQCMDLEQTLEDMGHNVLAVAQHVPGAIRALEAVGGEVDCVLLDVVLAGDTATSVASELDRRGIRYMAVTGLREADVKECGLTCPVVAKPYSTLALRKGLRAIREQKPSLNRTPERHQGLWCR